MISDMKQEKIEIRALPNADAKNQLINSLYKMEGIKRASIDSSGEVVKVTYDEPASAQQIQHCIRGAGNKIR